MADKVDGCEQETSIISIDDSNENQSDGGMSSTLEKRYSLKEANEIGKEMLESIQSALAPKVCRGRGKTEDIEDPHVKAWKYMEECNVLLMLEILLTKLVYEKPEVPMQFMADEIQKMKGKDIRSYQAYKEESTQK
ncbi:uncharacterized protein LOC116300936 [Actinia tenebrosa]|uniref:Uncharacterized protein LOC116300936 n=1 Tax=Actinia tenebrosa TaxID=6105 RepID=A0A6P8IGD1_ACTTE|nr:uncharacterized protein LOC116300936 [Actinia tenebrosa]